MTDLSTPRDLLLSGKRDALGFLESDVPSLSASQVNWLTFRMGTETNDEATTLSTATAEDVERWLADTGFMAVLDTAIHNKREGFRLIGAQLLPNALRTISALYEKAEKEGNMRAAQLALNMHLRSQGLLVDKVATDDRARVDVLLDILRESQPIRVIDMAPRP